MASRMIVTQNSKATSANGQSAGFTALSPRSSSSSGSITRVKTRSLAELYKQTEEVEDILISITPVSPPSYKEVAERTILRKGMISPICPLSFHNNSSGNSSSNSSGKIFTACSTIDFKGNEFKALVYEYMENGSLEEWLHPNVSQEEERGTLSLVRRLSIAIEIASAVEYLHQDCEPPIIHCDLKPSNVLLDAQMTAHVGDFGLARILSTEEVVLQASSVGVIGTIGYSPPEYGMGSEVSREGDVYSYGILLLEMFMGKRPTDNIFGDAWNIRSYCEAALPARVMEIEDPCLFSNELGGEGSSVRAPRRVRECLEKVFEVGIGCCRELPGERMDIREAAAKLRSIKALAR